MTDDPAYMTEAAASWHADRDRQKRRDEARRLPDPDRMTSRPVHTARAAPVQAHEPASLSAHEQPAPAPVQFDAVPFKWRDPAKIPRREFLFGHHYIRDYVSGTVAKGGSGKTTLVQTEAISMVAGHEVIGIIPPPVGLNVWYWNLEDPAEEIERRFAAIVQHHDLRPAVFPGVLHVNSGRTTPLIIASKVRETLVVAEPVIEALVREIKASRIDVLIVDPFVSSHALPENDNTAIDAAVKAWGRVAGRGNCSVELVHHSRKLNGDTISAESARGGSAFVDACRSVRVLSGMGEADAAKLGVEEPRRFFYVMPDKANMAPPADKRDWYQLVSVVLPNGDNVAAAERWSPPNPFDDVTPDHLRRVQAQFAAGNFRESEQSPEWGGYVVADVIDLDAGRGLKANERTAAQKAVRSKIKRMLKTWIENDAIGLDPRMDAQRRERLFFVSRDGATHVD